MSRRQHAAFPHLIYSPTDRRRLARAMSGPHRLHARRASLRRHEWTGFTRANVERLIMLAVPGLRLGDFEIREHVGYVVIAVRRPKSDLFMLSAMVHANRPFGLSVDVVSSLP